METGLFEMQADQLRTDKAPEPDQCRGKLSTQGPDGLILSIPTSIENRSALLTEVKTLAVRAANALIRPSTLHVAFCVSPICGPANRSAELRLGSLHRDWGTPLDPLGAI
jgi:hypothetical protein